MVYQKQAYPYTEKFCEENIWRLGQQLAQEGDNIQAAYVLMLSNQRQQIPLLQQRCVAHGQIVWWDYHVVLLDYAQRRVFDFDTRLPFPCAVDVYFDQTFTPITQLASDEQVWLRVISLSDYLAYFSSDRTHMLSTSGQRLSAWPPYPQIKAATDAITLMQYLDFEQVIQGSRVLHVDACRTWLDDQSQQT